jgi:hypothetical protein
MNGAFKVLALGIVLAQVLADQLKPFPAGQACGVLALACWSTSYVWEFRCNGPGSCIDLNDRFWACPFDPVMSWMRRKSAIHPSYPNVPIHCPSSRTMSDFPQAETNRSAIGRTPCAVDTPITPTAFSISHTRFVLTTVMRTFMVRS